MLVAPRRRWRLAARLSRVGHGLWSMAGADLIVVLSKGHIAYQVQAVLDGPVLADRVGELGGGDVVVGQVGDRVHGFAAGPLAGKGPNEFG